MSELIKCDICGEDINPENESYRIGENHEGDEITFCESCDNSELEDAAHCIPYGVEWADSEKYYYTQHYKLMNEYYEDINHTTDSKKFPIEKMYWKSTDGWRGYFDYDFKEGWETIDGWITGWLEDSISHKQKINDFLQSLAEDESTHPNFPLWVITVRTSNVFSTACDILFRTKDKPKLEKYLKAVFGWEIHDLQTGLK